MTGRQALVFAVAVCASILLLVTFRFGPRAFNHYRLRQLQGREVYDERVDAQQAYAASLAKANQQHKQLLVMLGGNWCQWCLALDDLMRRDEALRRFVADHFVVLKLDTSRAKSLDESWGKPSRQGVPVLIFIAPSGKLRHVQETGSLELWHGRILRHDATRLLGVLEQWS
jgi:thioredoxin-related protein